MMNIREEAHRMKLVAPKLAATKEEVRNAALAAIAENLKAHQQEIFAENHKDLDAARENGISDAVMKRLKFDEGKLKSVVDGIAQLIILPDPVGKVQFRRSLDEGLELERISVPIGVIGVIFEARPDALVQISSLCIKSGNCAVLKGGKETTYTNRILFKLIVEALSKAGLPEGILVQAEQHNEIDELLQCEGDVDLLIPRGSNTFVQYIMNHTKIPVMGHADGVCHIYVDEEISDALTILVDAKTQYTAACNAMETVLVKRSIAGSFLPKLYDAMTAAHVTMRGSEEVKCFLGERGKDFEVMAEDAYHKEYTDLICSVKCVENVEEAVEHINRFGSHHTDSVLTNQKEVAEYFLQMVDSAGVYHNCSTRFADGFRYGFGAEVGISTSKLHARGPVGLEGLMTYKYKLRGHGQIVGDYASGVKEFHFKDL